MYQGIKFNLFLNKQVLISLTCSEIISFLPR